MKETAAVMCANDSRDSRETWSRPFALLRIFFLSLFSEGVYEKAGSEATGTCDASVSLSETNRPRNDIQPDLAVGRCSNTL